MSRAEAALEIARLTEILADAVEVGDMDAAGRVMTARAAVAAGAARAFAPDELAVIASAAAAVRAAEARVAARLRHDIADTRAAIGALAAGRAAVSAYEGHEGLTAGFVDRRD